jgi:hypothetical protein
MSETELRRMFDQASRFCEAHFATYGEISPMWHAVTSSDETIIEPHPIYLVDKDIAMALVRAFFDARDVVRYVYIGEAWTLNTLVKREEVDALMRDGIADHPGRVEIVQLQGEDRECGQIKIIRPKEGKPYLGPLETVGDLIPASEHISQSEGRMVGVLPVRGTRQ